MWLALAVVFAGAAAWPHLVTGRPRHLARPPVRLPGLLGAALLLGLVADRVELPGGVALRLVAVALAVAAAVANLAWRGAGLAALALVVAALPVALNGAVTVPPRTAAALEVAPDDLGPGRRLERPGDHLHELGAVIPLPPLDRSISFPALVAALAGVHAVSDALGAPRRRRRHRRSGRPRRPAPARPGRPALATGR